MKPGPNLKGARLLLVEDDDINREVALDLLQGEGVDVDTAVNGREALDKLSAGRYDGVLMDCQMPVMDGFAATRALRKLPGLDSLPVIAMTASSTLDDRDQALAAGMNDHIAKPIDIDEVIQTLARWVSPRPKEAVPDVDPRLHSLPGLDGVEALKRMRGNEALLRKSLQRFLQAYADFEPRFQSTWSSAEAEGARRMAHDLQSLAGTLGMKALRQHALALEQACIAGDAAAVPARLQDLSAELAVVLAGLAAWAQSD
ncbi:Hpt domain-containing response regulator [Piscinibacter terrae]|nr:response regulator [Albitalea terrae]